MKHIFTSILLFMTTAFFAQPVQFNFSSNTGQVAVGGTIDVDVKVSDFNNVAGMQFAIHWDEDMLEVASIENVNADVIGFNQSNIAYGTVGFFGSLRLSWSGVTEVSLPDDAILFTMRMNAIGDACDDTVFDIYGSDVFPIEIFDFDLNFKEFCTNTYVSQIEGPECIASLALACNDMINVSLSETKVVLITPDMVLEGGPYDYTRVTVEPSKLTCADIGVTYEYIATDLISDNSCWGFIQVEDVIGYCDGSGTGNDILVCNSDINVTLTSDGVANIFVESVLEGGPYDYTSLSLVPSVLNCDDIGTTQYTVTDAITGSSCFGKFIVQDILGACEGCENPDVDAPTPYCINLSTAILDQGSVELYAIDFDAGSFDNCTDASDLRYTFDDVNPSSDPSFLNVANSSVRVFTEADLNGMDEITIPISTYVWDESNNRDFCQHNLRLVKSSGNSSVLSLRFPNVNTQTNAVVCLPLTVEGFTNVSSMQATVSWDPQVLQYKNTQSYVLPGLSSASFNGTNDSNLPFVWFDNSGVTPQTFADGSTLFEVCFDVVGSDGQSSIVQLVDMPTDIEFTNDNGQTIAVNTIAGSVTIGIAADCINDVTPPVAVCDINTVVNTGNGSVTLSADSFDNGSYDNCTTTSALLFTYADGSSSKEFNIMDADANGEIVIAMNVTDESSNTNTCFSTLKLVGGNCDIDEDDIFFPTTILNVEVVINDASEVSTVFEPDALLARPEFDNEDVYPTFSVPGCSNIGFSYQDNVFVVDATQGWYKVLRQWTVIDWLTTDIYNGDQIIKNYGQPDEYICDTLPRSAPVGDCASGHTLTDDVEWPNDISISDHRIKPSELIMASMVDSLDARPNFYEDAQFYTLSYIDFVNDLTQQTLVIDREWTAERTDIIGLSWTYTQKITIDLSTFGRLVTVNTLNNRPVPDVDIDGISMTNEQGFVYTEADVNPSKPDNADNGLNILDLILMQAHQLSVQELGELQVMAGDINGDQAITNSDISSVRKVILGIDDQLSSAWTFVDMTSATESGLEPKGHYIALKPGDVDDSAVLLSDVVVDATETIYIQDTILNAGQTYSIPLFFGRDIASLGAELHLDFDNTALSIRSVSATDAFGEISWSLDGDNRIVILNYNGNGEAEMITNDTPILTIEFEATQNGLLDGLFGLSDDKDSWIVDEDYGLLLIDDVFTGEIGTSTASIIEDLGVSVYPNPASDFVTFDMSNVEQKADFSIQIIDITGRIIVQSNNETQINLANVESGMYLYKITIADQAQTGKLLIKK